MFSKKARKFARSPGLFFRDMMLNRYPVQLSERVSDKAASKSSPKSRATKPLAKHVSSPPPASLKWDALDERIIVPNKLPVAFPIDVVFTWVDSEAPGFISEYNRFAPEMTQRREVGDIARFQSTDELKYAIRSIFAYAPWVRQIYIVTNGQVPSWLDVSHPKIRIVTHQEILEPRYLPTFNSHVIESAIHKIPDLSEHYLYFNDDMMLTRPVVPEYFFTGSGLAYLFISKVVVPNTPINDVYDSPSEWGAKNARALIFEEFKVYVDQMFAHTFYPQLKSVAVENEARWPDAFHVCRQNRFRAPSDILCTGFLHPHMAHLQGKGLFTKTRLFYFNVRKREALKYYMMLIAKKDTPTIPISMCPNDRSSTDGDEFPDYAERLRDALDTFYPKPSPAERLEVPLSSPEVSAAE